MIGAGILILLVAEVWLILLAFQESSATGLLYLFLPFYRIVFIATNLEQTGPPVLVAAFGVVYVLAGIGVSIVAGKAWG
jgi:hypothetical protein